MMEAIRLAVLNPRGRDPEQVFSEGAGSPHAAGHPPVNFHACAAATGGSFHRSVAHALAADCPVLVLLRRRTRISLDAIRRLKASGRTVLVSWKESGSQQVAGQLTRAAAREAFAESVRAADGVLAAVPDLLPVYRACDPEKADSAFRILPLPCPLEEPGWDFSTPLTERGGILIGTREFDVPSRQHLAGLSLAARISTETGASVTVIDTGNVEGRRALASLPFPPGKLHVVPGPLPYPRYLETLAKHRLVLQLDRSAVPGQVAGDCLLCQTLCVGGDSATERVAFPETTGFGRNIDEIQDLTHSLLDDDDRYTRVIEDSQKRARQHLSFHAFRQQLAEFLGGLGHRE